MLMAVVNHPNVVQFHDACLRDNLAMIVLEYMEVCDSTLSSAHCEVMMVIYHASGDENFWCSMLP